MPVRRIQCFRLQALRTLAPLAWVVNAAASRPGVLDAWNGPREARGRKKTRSEAVRVAWMARGSQVRPRGRRAATYFAMKHARIWSLSVGASALRVRLLICAVCSGMSIRSVGAWRTCPTGGRASEGSQDPGSAHLSFDDYQCLFLSYHPPIPSTLHSSVFSNVETSSSSCSATVISVRSFYSSLSMSETAIYRDFVAHHLHL